MKKMTYVEALTVVLDTCELKEEVSERLEALKETLEKRASAKTAAVDTAMAELMEKVFRWMTEKGEKVKASEVAKALDLTSGQKATAVLNKLADEDKVEREKDSKGVWWSVK